MSDWTVIEGDVLDADDLTEGRFDAVLCDPPYGLGDPLAGDDLADMLGAWLEGRDADAAGSGFMASDWDRVQGPPAWEAIRSVTRPGAFMASFGGTRTFDMQCVAQRLAGWALRDEVLALAWTYGSGFPKSHDVSKAIDKTKGAEREVVGEYQSPEGTTGFSGQSKGQVFERDESRDITAPATDEADRWDGWGTALAPAHEPIGLWRHPTDRTYAETALEEGCGGLNIDGCRTATVDGETVSTNGRGPQNESGRTIGGAWSGECDTSERDGRWPTNTVLVHHPDCGEQCHEDCHVRRMDEQSGGRPAGADSQSWTGHDDSGGASRYFPRFRYMAKAARSEREAGLHHRETQTVDDGRDKAIDNAYQRGETDRRNTHPTVKPIQLCKWIATLLLPPPGDQPRRLLVPYAGSGSEMIGAMLAGWDEVIGIEQYAEYADLARDRLTWWGEHGEDAVEAHKAEQKRREHERETGQTTLLEGDDADT